MPGEHGVIIGKTGSGKSVLAATVLAKSYPMFANVAVIIPKQDTGFLSLLPFNTGKFTKTKVYVPSAKEFQDIGYYDGILKDVYAKGKTLVYIDDLLPLHRRNPQGPEYLSILVQLGRSKGISVLSAVQRPKRVPLNTLSECTHYWFSELSLDDDILRARELVHTYPQFLPTLAANRHSFLYANENDKTRKVMKVQTNSC